MGTLVGIPSAYIQNWAWWVQICIPSLEEIEIERILELADSQAWLNQWTLGLVRKHLLRESEREGGERERVSFISQAFSTSAFLHRVSPNLELSR